MGRQYRFTGRMATAFRFGKIPINWQDLDREGMKVGGPNMTPPMTTDEQRNMVLSILVNFADEPDNSVNYLDHVGFDIGTLSDPKELPHAWVAHPGYPSSCRVCLGPRYASKR